MRWCALLLLLLPSLLLGQTQMSVEANGQKIGSAVFDYEVGRDKSIGVMLKLTIATGGEKMVTDSTVQYDRTGLRKSERHAVTGPGHKQLLTVLYSGRRATISKTLNGRKSKTSHQIPAGQTFASPSILWFIRTTPRVGQKASYWLFDPNTNKLEKRTVHYVSTMQMKLKGKDYTSHFVKSSDGTKAWVDDEGRPFRMEYETNGIKLVMVRQ